MTSIKMGFCLIPTSKLCNLLSKLLINLRVQSRLRLLEENSDGKTYFSPHNHSVLTPADSRESGSAGTKSQKKTNKKMWRGVVVVGGGMDVAPAALLFGIWEQHGCRRIKPVGGRCVTRGDFRTLASSPPTLTDSAASLLLSLCDEAACWHSPDPRYETEGWWIIPVWVGWHGLTARLIPVGLEEHNGFLKKRLNRKNFTYM